MLPKTNKTQPFLSYLPLLFFCIQSFGQSKQPNILVIFYDDHAQQTISAYGSKLMQTPSIDRIAKEGAIFTNTFVTNSICAPARAVLLTGKYSHLNGLKDNAPGRYFNGEQEQVQKLLQQANYQTAWIGKWHLQSLPKGFDYWKILPEQGNYFQPHVIRVMPLILSVIFLLIGSIKETQTNPFSWWLVKKPRIEIGCQTPLILALLTNRNSLILQTFLMITKTGKQQPIKT